ncbi:heavy metal translocating p-type ATPase [Candidatus Symbiothrix dinenymphae]|nr:heavy metal translocating p-type ATPase [Candidatus Symbiothrix dinenymphae]
MGSIKRQFDITGMSCAGCVAHVEHSVARLGGVQLVQVNLLTHSMMVEFDTAQITVNAIEQAVFDAGYQAYVRPADARSADARAVKSGGIDFVRQEQRAMRRRWWVSFAFLLPLLYVSMGDMLFGHGGVPAVLHENFWLQLVLVVPVVVVNRNYFVGGFRALFRFAPNMDSLIAVGSSAALAYGLIYNGVYFESAATILSLVTLGKYLESRSKSRTSAAITKLMDLAPKTAIVVRGDKEQEVPVEDIVVGDLLLVKPGQHIPVDGTVTQGNATIDESALTGESMPVYKQVGDTVFSATFNKTGAFFFRATKVGKDTTLSHIVALVEEASASKAPVSRLADKISRVFVPVIIGIAVFAAVGWFIAGYPFDFALSIGIAVLVISCPCALGLATPVAIMVGTGKGAEHGILFKSAEVFEKAVKINTVVLDKTGTITEGKLRVTDIYTNGMPEDEVLSLIASLERYSEHPLAAAVLQEAKQQFIDTEGVAGQARNDESLDRSLDKSLDSAFDSAPLLEVANFQALPGLGIEGRIRNRLYCAGSHKLMVQRGIDISHFTTRFENLTAEGKTPLFLADEHTAIGLLAVADTLKPTSRQAVEQLYAMGMDAIMLTGDNRQTATAIQREAGIHSLIAEVLPQEKDREIVRLQAANRSVAMVGDGINDAPALTRADLGIAIGSGTDIAVESADIVLMRSDLLDAVAAFRLSQAVMRTIKQNLFWAFSYNIICIPLAAGAFYPLFGWTLNPMIAALAMSFSSVTVVLNALRLNKTVCH